MIRKWCPIMVREGQDESPPDDPADTPVGRQARVYGMKFTAAIVVLTIIIVTWALMR